jgi:branched-chain amino acid transport system substrate-binding protein
VVKGFDLSRLRSWRSLMALTLAAGLGAWIAASSSPARAAEHAAKNCQFKVLYIGPFSGPLAIVGPQEKAGLTAGAAVINSSGGILGCKVVISSKDDAGVGTQAVPVAETVVKSGTPYDLLVPGAFGADSIPMDSVFAHTPVLQITLASEPQNNQPKKFPYLYVPTGGYGPQELALVKRMKAQGIRKFAIVTGNDTSGIEEAAARAEAASSVGLTVTATELVPGGATDATPQMQAALATGPQAITLAAFDAANCAILTARANLAPKLPVYMDPFASSQNFATCQSASQLKGVYLEQFPYLVQGTSAQNAPAWKAFIKQDQKFDPKPVLALDADQVAYDAVMQARCAAKKAGQIRGAKMALALQTIALTKDCPGDLAGTKLYTPTNHDWGVLPGDYGFYPAGPITAGLIVPGS